MNIPERLWSVIGAEEGPICLGFGNCRAVLALPEVATASWTGRYGSLRHEAEKMVLELDLQREVDAAVWAALIRHPDWKASSDSTRSGVASSVESICGRGLPAMLEALAEAIRKSNQEDRE